jgi:serine/threonine protein kinase
VLKENRACTFSLEGKEYKDVDPFIMDLLKKMLKINPEERITADQALSHPFFK